jgi:hypothetical protein
MSNLLKTKHGLFTTQSENNTIYQNLKEYGEFNEANFQVLCNFIEKDDILIDVGSDFGYLSVFLSRKLEDTGKIIAFDCQKHKFHETCANTAINSLGNIYPSKLMIGEKSESCTFKNQNVIKITLDSLNLPKFKLLALNFDKNQENCLMGAKSTLNRHKPLVFTQGKKSKIMNELGFQHIKVKSSSFNKDNYYGSEQKINNFRFFTNNLYIHPDSSAWSQWNILNI